MNKGAEKRSNCISIAVECKKRSTIQTCLSGILLLAGSMRRSHWEPVCFTFVRLFDILNAINILIKRAFVCFMQHENDSVFPNIDMIGVALGPSSGQNGHVLKITIFKWNSLQHQYHFNSVPVALQFCCRHYCFSFTWLAQITQSK